jgi:hypothetical protein
LKISKNIIDISAPRFHRNLSILAASSTEAETFWDIIFQSTFSILFDRRERENLKKVFIAIVLILSISGTVFASGDNNHGTTGSGSTSTGSEAPGQADQSRSGR